MIKQRYKIYRNRDFASSFLTGTESCKSSKMYLVFVPLLLIFSLAFVSPFCPPSFRPCAETMCCCGSNEVLCSDLVDFPTRDFKILAMVINLQFAGKCLKNLNVTQTEKVLPALETIEFTNRNCKCLKIPQGKIITWKIQGRTVCSGN